MDAFLESVADKSTPEELAVIENGISEMKMGIDERIMAMEKSSLDLRRTMSKHEADKRALQEQQLQDNISRRTGAVKKHFKPTVALMPEKLNKDVKPEEFSRWREQWISWRNEAVGDDTVSVKKLIPYIVKAGQFLGHEDRQKV